MCVSSWLGIIVELKDTEEKYNKLTVENEDSVASYYKIRQQLDNLGKELLTFIQKPQYILPFLQPGRLVQVSLVLENRYLSTSCLSYKSVQELGQLLSNFCR